MEAEAEALGRDLVASAARMTETMAQRMPPHVSGMYEN